MSETEPQALLPPLMGAHIGAGQSGADNAGDWEAFTDSHANALYVDDIWAPDTATAMYVAQANIAAWHGVANNLVVCVPLTTYDGMRLADAATGAMDDVWDTIGEALVAAEFPHAVCVIGKMWNEERFAWHVKRGSERAYQIAWRRAAQRIKAKCDTLTCDWVSSTRNQSNAVTDLVFPGRDLVDRIGLAVYPQTWMLEDPEPWDGTQGPRVWAATLLNSPYGLNWARSYANKYNKRLSIPEWSVGNRADGYGMGQDNPRILDNIMAWCGANNVEYACYWDVDYDEYAGKISDGQRPEQAAKYLQWLGVENTQPIPPDPVEPPDPAPATDIHRGGYTGAGSTGVDQYNEGWRHHVTPVFEIAMAAPPFYNQTGGGALNDIVGNAGWNIASWASAGLKHICWSVPLATTDGPDLDACNRGDMDWVWRDQANILIDNGYADAYVRPGWEWNGEWWFPWYAGAGREALYASVFRRCVDQMRSVGRGQAFRFDWSPNVGQNVTMDYNAAYPGDDHCDIIGMDFYMGAGYIGESWDGSAAQIDRIWAKHASNDVFFLGWQYEFAKAHGKHMAFGEWAMGTCGTGGLGPDNPELMQKFLAWINEKNASDGPHVLYQAYYSEDNGWWQTEIHHGSRPQQTAVLRDWIGG